MNGTVVVVNRTAGAGKAGRAWDAISRHEPRLEGAVVICEPAPEAALARLDEALASRPVGRVLVVGGDGTLSRVGDHLLKRPPPAVEMRVGEPIAPRLPAIGLIPAGTGSDLARPLGLPRDPAAALERALRAPARPLDVVEVTAGDGRRRFAVNIASAGVSGQVDEAVAALPRRGLTAYLRATLGALARYRPVPCRVSVDGEAWHQGGILLLVVANGTTFGRGMRIAPLAELDDGLAEVVLVPRLPGWQVPIQLPRLYRGTHLTSPWVRYRRARVVEIEPLAPLPPLDVDGDPWPVAGPTGGVGPALRLALRPGALRVLA